MALPQTFALFGVTLHVYGLLIGLAVALLLLVTERVLQSNHFSTQVYWKLVGFGVVGALLGARAWHVMTDWQLYRAQPLASLYIWQGGLSILGAVLGGTLAVLLGYQVMGRPRSLTPVVVFDALVLTLPFSQAIGRLGNFVNQELFGLPSTLPWAITIPAPLRPVGFEQVTTFHPLFAYEILLLLLIGTGLWWFFRQRSVVLGTGVLSLLYLCSYSLARFGLDFLRLQKPVVFAGLLGFNQAVLLGVGLLSGALLLRLWLSQKRSHPRH